MEGIDKGISLVRIRSKRPNSDGFFLGGGVAIPRGLSCVLCAPPIHTSLHYFFFQGSGSSVTQFVYLLLSLENLVQSGLHSISFFLCHDSM